MAEQPEIVEPVQVEEEAQVPGGYDDILEGVLAEKTAASLSVITDEKPEALTPREYLERSVVPLVLQGFNELVKQRPSNPVEYLAVYLLKNNPQRD